MGFGGAGGRHGVGVGVGRAGRSGGRRLIPRGRRPAGAVRSPAVPRGAGLSDPLSAPSRRPGAEAPPRAGRRARPSRGRHHRREPARSPGCRPCRGGLGTALGLDHRAAQFGELHPHHTAHIGVVLSGSTSNLPAGHYGSDIKSGSGLANCSPRRCAAAAARPWCPRPAAADARRHHCLVKPYTIGMPATAPMQKLPGGEEGLEDPRQCCRPCPYRCR